LRKSFKNDSFFDTFRTEIFGWKGAIMTRGRDRQRYVSPHANIKEVPERARIAVFEALFAEMDSPSPCLLPVQNREGEEAPEFGMGTAYQASPFQIPVNMRADTN
jgi:hypothetical protein